MKTKEALAQPEPEPVAYRYQMPVGDGHWVWNYCTYPDNKDDPCCEPLYTHPKGWVGLTDEEARVKFESWHKAEYVQPLERYGHTYKNMHVRNRWQGWLAANGIKEKNT